MRRAFRGAKNSSSWSSFFPRLRRFFRLVVVGTLAIPRSFRQVTQSPRNILGVFLDQGNEIRKVAIKGRFGAGVEGESQQIFAFFGIGDRLPASLPTGRRKRIK